MGWGIAAIVLIIAVLPLASQYDRARTESRRELMTILMTSCVILGPVFIFACAVTTN
jgi:hypothetical protein